MKKGNFSGLLYRELLISGKKIAEIPFVLLFTIVLCLLFKGSTVYGNMRPEIVGEEVADTMKEMFMIMDLLPIVMAALIPITISESAARDELLSWQRFRRTTPVSPYKMAAAKYIVFSGSFLVSLAVGIAYTAIIRAFDTPTALTGTPMLMFIFSVCIIVSVVFQTTIMFFHSMDKAGICLFLIMFAGVMIPSFVTSAKAGSEQVPFDELLERAGRNAEKLCPYTVTAAVIVFIAGYFAAAMIMGRREK